MAHNACVEPISFLNLFNDSTDPLHMVDLCKMNRTKRKMAGHCA